MPVISVIIPAFNRAQQLERAVRSVLSQSFADFEVIVIDDGSTDDLSGACPALHAPPVRLIRQQNLGPAAARNAGIDAAQGEMVLFLDSDDMLVPDTLALLYECLQNCPRADIAHGWAITVDQGGAEALWTQPKLTGLVYRRYLYRNPTPLGTLLARRKILGVDQRFDAQLALLEDWDFWLRLSFRNAFAYVPAVVARINFESIRRNTSRPAQVVRDTVRAIYAKALLDPQADLLIGHRRHLLAANVHVVVGHHYRLYLGDMPAARREFLAALRLAPNFVPAYVGLAETLMGTRATHWMRVARSRVLAGGMRQAASFRRN